jgi:hypothetical protein
MRIQLFFISFCFFLFGYGQGFSDNSKGLDSAKSNTYERQVNKLKFYSTSEHKDIAYSDCTDIELEEDNHTNEESVASDPKLFLVKSNRADNWNLEFTKSLFIATQNTNFFIVCLQSTPIYIKNRVLRI